MRLKHNFPTFFVVFLFIVFCNSMLSAQDLVEAPVPQAFVTDKNGDEEMLSEGASFTGEAPLNIKFVANAKDFEGFSHVCVWRFVNVDDNTEFLTRYDEEVDYLFNVAGTFNIQLFVTYTSLTDKNLVLEYEFEPFSISISESSLKVPNAFSPNGDGINDFFNVYDVKSIISFSAAIYNRWGQQLYKWGIDEIGCSDCGWDGTYKGSPVKDGVYFVVISAMGADGIKYDIRSDVNILRGFIEESK